ncbi:MAG: hypothetical protein SGPRY_010737 [Prymnesium sp.]
MNVHNSKRERRQMRLEDDYGTWFSFEAGTQKQMREDFTIRIIWPILLPLLNEREIEIPDGLACRRNETGLGHNEDFWAAAQHLVQRFAVGIDSRGIDQVTEPVSEVTHPAFES